ncbi:MAG: hypothetical protein JO022_14955 [Acidobacteriaceae bacterium]|nr:hypothetical protein [Acidobacteriaceae bacterium]
MPESFLNVVSTNHHDGSRRALAAFIKEDAALRKSIVERFSDPVAGAGPPAVQDKNAVARFLTRYGMSVAETGDYLRGSSALLFALLVVPDYLEAVGGMAILYHAWEDKIAARWAEHFSDLTSGDLPPHAYLLEAEELTAETDLLRKQMRAILSECEQHPEWRDSSKDLQKFGMLHEGRYASQAGRSQNGRSQSARSARRI